MRTRASSLAAVFTAVVCVAGGTVALSPPTAAAPATVALSSGAVFSNPAAGPAEQRRVINHVEDAIDAAPPGARVRIATYNFTIEQTADKLIAAQRRGVEVDLVVNGRRRGPSPLLRRMDRAGIDLTSTRGAARSPGGGNMHVKLFLFSRTAGARHVVMVGSVNLAEAGITRLWNDLYTAVGDQTLYREYVAFHKELMADRTVANPHETFESGPYQGTLYPHPGTDYLTDDMWLALDSIEPQGATVRVCMYTWSGDRGADLAHKLVEMHQAGADVAVTHNGLDGSVAAILRGGGVDVFDSRRDADGDGEKDTYVHHKYLLLAQPTQDIWATYTGSHNWNDGSLRRGDETTLRIAGEDVFASYLQQFELIRSTG